MFKKIFFHALSAGAMTATAAIIYTRIYFIATEVDFKFVLNTFRLISLSILACFIAAFLYWGLISWLGKKGEILFNFLFSIISFACVMIPISITLPLTVKYPELFPGLAVPMVFFPAIAWHTVQPLFAINDLNTK